MSRLCLICVSLRAGGTEQVVTQIANYLSRQHEVSLVTLSATPPFYSLRQDILLRQPEFGSRSEIGATWYWQIMQYLRSTLKEVQPDLVLCFGESIAPVVLPTVRLAGTRALVFNRASPMSSLRGKRGILNPLTYPLADKVVVQTRRAADVMGRRYRFSRFFVLPNPVDVPDEVPSMQQRSRRIINVGTLGGRKNQQALIRIFSGLKRKKGWELDFIGDGPDRLELERLTECLGLQDRVRFLGQRQNVQELLQDSRIFAFSSLTEGFPNALAEALAAGCACISYDCPTGPADLIENEINGLLVPNGDEVAFRDSLQRLIGDPVLQSRFAGAARQHILKFKAEVVLERFQALVRESLPEPALKKVP